MDMLKFIPKPLQEDFINNRVVPLIGAGFSKNGIIANGENIPDWGELGKAIAQYMPDYTYTNALDAISLFESEFSRGKLIETLAKETKVNFIQPGSAHQALAKILFETICTTNFDFLIEQTLTEQKIPHSTIVSEERLSINTKEQTKVIKIHGDFNHPSRMIITESDYDNFVDKNKVLSTYISNLFITKTLLLVGYSLDDTDIRTLWSVIGSRLGKLQTNAYAVLVDATPLEISRFARRNVKVINIKGSKANYPNLLTKFFESIKNLIDSKLQERTIFTDDKAVEEKKIQDSTSRLCFISAPVQRISFLNEMLKPMLTNYGLTPITINDVISPGESFIRKIDTIINQSGLMIIDVSDINSNVMWELSNAVARNKKIILVAEKEHFKSIPFNLSQYHVVTYSYSENNIDFSLNIENILSDYVKTFEINNLNFDAERLLQQGEYNSAAIMAFRQLEIFINEHLPFELKDEFGSITGIKLVKLMKAKTEYAYELIKKCDEYRTIRNRLVHTDYSIPKKLAKEIILTITNICKAVDEKEIILLRLG